MIRLPYRIGSLEAKFSPDEIDCHKVTAQAREANLTARSLSDSSTTNPCAAASIHQIFGYVAWVHAAVAEEISCMIEHHQRHHEPRRKSIASSRGRSDAET
jgi:hypothetical protein